MLCKLAKMLNCRRSELVYQRKVTAKACQTVEKLITERCSLRSIWKIEVFTLIWSG